MKAGLITFHYAHHYGAQLQAYALMNAVEKNGITCDIIDYVRQDTLDASHIFTKGFSVYSIARNLHSLLHYKSFKLRRNRFNAFLKNYMKLSQTAYSTQADLYNNPPEYDVFICGSDQIWNPVIYTEKTFDKAFFMDFTNKRKIAYAPSFGISSIPDHLKSELKSYLDAFSHISVREYEGLEIIRDLIGIKPPVVLDPTLLLNKDEWGKLAVSKKHTKPYMLCYFVTAPTSYYHLISEVARSKGLTPIWLCGNRKAPKGFKKIYSCGPSEFLGLFQNASFVCTNSFHGTVFSVLFQREFLCFSNLFQYKEVTTGTKMLNSRVYTLLKKLQLEQRLIPVDCDDNISDLLNRLDTIDYEKTDLLLEEERHQSLLFLSDAINNPNTIK